MATRGLSATPLTCVSPCQHIGFVGHSASPHAAKDDAYRSVAERVTITSLASLMTLSSSTARFWRSWAKLTVRMTTFNVDEVSRNFAAGALFGNLMRDLIGQNA